MLDRNGRLRVSCGHCAVRGSHHLADLLCRHGCFPEVPPDGECLASAEDTVQEITAIEQVQGDWWVVRGVNCGQDDTWMGGYDW